MYERVAGRHNTGEPFPDLIIQYHPDLGEVGIGLEPTKDPTKDVKHFIDAIYGENQTEIGKILHERLMAEGAFVPLDFTTKDKEDEFHNKLGRWCLDAVGGSSLNNGYWSYFNRAAINRIIRLLRKARDITFGRDE